MEKFKSNRETDKLIDELTRDVLVRYTCQFFKKSDKGMTPYGSGVFVMIHNTHFIITASHVADYVENDNMQLWIRVGHKDFINLIGHFQYTKIEKSKNIDLAYIKLDKQMLEPLSKPYYFLTIDKLRHHNKMLDGIHYCVLGFPENNIKRDEKGVLSTGAATYILTPAKDNRYSHYKRSKSDWHILNVKGKGVDLATGDKKVKVNTHFHGISGCGLWFLIYNRDPFTNKLWIDYRLIGIMTEYKNDKYFCLIGNKIHLIIQALEVIEKMKFKRIAV